MDRKREQYNITLSGEIAYTLSPGRRCVGVSNFGEDLRVILDEKLDDDVAKLDLHDRRHRLLLTAHQRWSEADA